MALYEADWVGLDRGREGLWDRTIWMGVLEAVGRYPGNDVYDPSAPIYAWLERRFPRNAWMSIATGEARPLFRDYANAWTDTKVLSLEGHKFRLTPLGKKVVRGEVSQEKVVEAAMASFRTEAGENPYAILAAALLEARTPLGIGDLFHGVMRRYRPGSDRLVDALRLGRRSREQLTFTRKRRLRNMMTLLELVGGAVKSGNAWSTADDAVLSRIASGSVALSPGGGASTGGSGVRPTSRGQIGRPFQAVPETEGATSRTPVTFDPDKLGKARLEHAKVQNEYSGHLQSLRIDALEPAAGDPLFDLAWVAGREFFVCEVKTVSTSNESQQVRLGIGQVLDYRFQLSGRHSRTIPVLLLSRPPQSPDWEALCDSLGIRLAWKVGGQFSWP